MLIFSSSDNFKWSGWLVVTGIDTFTVSHDFSNWGSSISQKYMTKPKIWKFESQADFSRSSFESTSKYNKLRCVLWWGGDLKFKNKQNLNYIIIYQHSNITKYLLNVLNILFFLRNIFYIYTRIENY